MKGTEASRKAASGRRGLFETVLDRGHRWRSLRFSLGLSDRMSEICKTAPRRLAARRGTRQPTSTVARSPPELPPSEAALCAFSRRAEKAQRSTRPMERRAELEVPRNPFRPSGSGGVSPPWGCGRLGVPNGRTGERGSFVRACKTDAPKSDVGRLRTNWNFVGGRHEHFRAAS